MLYHQPLDKHQTVGRDIHSGRPVRPAMEREARPQGIYGGEGVIQAKTMIHYSPGRYDYDYDPEQGKYQKSVTVGREMHAELDPDDPKRGSSTGSGKDVHKDLTRYLNTKWGITPIRGHLLNDHLGGLSVEENLFPISHAANSRHLNGFEKYVKYFVYKPNEMQVSRVVYHVSVRNADDTQRFDEFHPRTKFDCFLTVFGREGGNPAGGEVLGTTAYSVLSDISNGGVADTGMAFEEGTPSSGNVGASWRPGTTNLESRAGGGDGYELHRTGAEQDSLGTVAYEAGESYHASVPWDKNAYGDREKGWGHVALKTYETLKPVLQGCMGEILSIVDTEGMYRMAAGKAEEAFRALNVAPEVKRPEVLRGIRSLYALDIKQAEEAAAGAKAEELFAQNEGQFIEVVMANGGDEEKSREALRQSYKGELNAIVARYLDSFYRKGLQAIADKVWGELSAVVIPEIWKIQDLQWISYMGKVVFPDQGMNITDIWNGLKEGVISYILGFCSDENFGRNCPFIYRIIRQGGPESILYTKVLQSETEKVSAMTASKIRQNIMSKLEQMPVNDEIEGLIWSMIGRGADAWTIMNELGWRIGLTPEQKSELLREAYFALPVEMGRENREPGDGGVFGDAMGGFFAKLIRGKYELLQNVAFRI